MKMDVFIELYRKNEKNEKRSEFRGVLNELDFCGVRK